MGQDGKAQRFTKPFGEVIDSKRKPPSAIGWIDKLYEFPHYNKTQLNFESLLFRKVDQRASDLFQKLIEENAPALTSSESEALAVFLMTLLHRSPAGIAAMRELSRIMLAEIRAEIRPRYPELRSPGDPVTVEEYEAGLSADAHLEHFSRIFRTAVISERVGQFLANLHWRKAIFSVDKHSLLLSDDPLIRTNGLANPEGHVAFPVTPRIAMIGVYEKNFFSQIFAQKEKKLITNVNVQAVESARHFVVDVDDKQSRFIVNRFGKKLRPTISEQSLKSKQN